MHVNYSVFVGVEEGVHEHGTVHSTNIGFNVFIKY